MTTKTETVKLPKILDGAASINSAIDKIQKSGTAFDKAVQTAALSVLNHASKHGDTTLADRLALAMPKGSRLKSLMQYLVQNGQLALLDKSLTTDAEAIKNGRVFKLDRAKPAFDLANASAKQWTDAIRAESVADVLDASKAVMTLVTRIERAAQSGNVSNIDGALVEARRLVTMLEGKRAA